MFPSLDNLNYNFICQIILKGVCVCKERLANMSPSPHPITAELFADIIYAFTVRPDGSLLPEWISGAIEPCTGYTVAEFNTCTIFDLVHPDDGDLLAQHRACLLAGQPSTVDYRILTKNSAIRLFSCRARPEVNEKGEVTRLVGAIQDITVRKEAEEALATQQRFMEQILELAPAIIYLFDLVQQRNLLMPLQLTKMLGYTPEEFQAMGRDVLAALMPPEDLIRIKDHFSRLASARDEEVLEFDHRMRHKDGRWRWFRSRDRVFARNAAGVPQTILGTAVDITEQKQTEQALRESEQRFRVALQNSPTMVYTTDHELRYTWVYNPLGGFQVEEVLGKRDEDLLPTESAAPLTALKQEVLASGAVTRREVAVNIHKGQGYYDVTLEPLYDSNGQISGLTVAATDISERKQHEEYLCKLNATLEENVAQRTAELQQRKDELNQMASLASDEIKGQLRGISYLANWLVEDISAWLPAQSQEHLEKLRQRTIRLAGMVDDFMAYLRTERHPVDIETVNTQELVATILESLHPLPTFTATIQGLPVLVTHRMPLEIVFRNLLDNAIRHHDRPDGHITIVAADQGAFIQFSIADDGPGIPPALHHQIFQVFRTLRPRDQVESSGMGLPIVRKVVETYRGRVWVESILGRGATFRFTWPKQVDPA